MPSKGKEEHKTSRPVFHITFCNMGTWFYPALLISEESSHVGRVQTAIPSHIRIVPVTVCGLVFKKTQHTIHFQDPRILTLSQTIALKWWLWLPPAPVPEPF